MAAVTTTDVDGAHRDTARAPVSPTAPTVVALQVAPPAILGLYGFAAATFAVSANQAGWFGDDRLTPLVLFPFALVLGGVAQLLAGLWAYRARDGLGTAMHGVWGSFWIAYGLYWAMVALDVLPSPQVPAAATAFGAWFTGLAAITWVGAVGATRQSAALTAVLGTLALGATLQAVALMGGAAGVGTAAALVLVLSALLAFYTASALLLEGSFGRQVLPVGVRTPLGAAPARW